MKTIEKQRSRSQAKPPAREEWDFRARSERSAKADDWLDGCNFDFLPDDEVWFCWNYEFTRTSSEVDGFLKWRSEADDPNGFDSLLGHYWRTDPNGKNGCALVGTWFYKIWPEWPDKPFLSISQKERNRRYQKTWERTPKEQLRLIPLREINRFVDVVKAGKNPELPGVKAPSTRIRLEPDGIVLRREVPGNTDVPREIVAFEIDFNLGDKDLGGRFQNWLARRRKERGYARQQQRGNSITKQYRAELRALGACRLLESGLSIKEAQDHTARVSGRVLYADAGDWSKAKRTAREGLWRV